jgi:predicted aminopeptidase
VNSSSIAARLRWAPVILIAASISGCYALQAACGQVRLMLERRPIARVIADPATPPPVARQLIAVAQIRDFATHTLDLPDNGSYRSYADVGREYVVWNVFAAPEFSVEPRQWCYPLVGCVAYRGYFKETAARAFAARLRRDGLDVEVGGVAAYSVTSTIRCSPRCSAGTTSNWPPSCFTNSPINYCTCPATRLSMRRWRRWSNTRACAAG